MTCHNCQLKAVKAGKDRRGNQRYRCDRCKRRFQAERERLLGNMYLSEDKAILVLSLLLEGNSIRSIERITEIYRLHSYWRPEVVIVSILTGNANDLSADRADGITKLNNRRQSTHLARHDIRRLYRAGKRQITFNVILMAHLLNLAHKIKLIGIATAEAQGCS